ncbi:hypothetical protein A9Q81_07175 [Gammaproteobacteria bacterium 42_54_T18]|nr:hypothetical protein A9Q81_07175 [Gammaproteobacteria bacterium 42_54_T18]
MKKNILIVGCGDVGTETGRRLQQLGYAVYGLKRTVSDEIPFPCVYGDVSDVESLSACFKQLPDDIHYLVYTVAPAERTEGAYHAAYPEGVKNCLASIDTHILQGFLLVTSTAVYHQQQGQWVDESTETLPTSFSGQKLLAAEDVLRNSAVKGVAVRLGGIYGPGRERLIKKVKNGCEINRAIPAYTNRIHRDDCAGILSYLIEMIDSEREVDSCYVGVDSYPVPEWDVLCCIASLLNINGPVDNEKLQVIRQNKRCRNDRIRSLGYEFTFEHYEDGYKQLIDSVNAV